MINPVTKIRKEKELTITEFAKIAGVGFSTLQNIEKSRTVNVNKKVLELLEKMGYNKEQILEEYKAYKKAEQEELLMKVIKK